MWGLNEMMDIKLLVQDLHVISTQQMVAIIVLLL